MAEHIFRPGQHVTWGSCSHAYLIARLDPEAPHSYYAVPAGAWIAEGVPPKFEYEPYMDRLTISPKQGVMLAWSQNLGHWVDPRDWYPHRVGDTVRGTRTGHTYVVLDYGHDDPDGERRWHIQRCDGARKPEDVFNIEPLEHEVEEEDDLT